MLFLTCTFLVGVILPTTWPFLPPLWILPIGVIAALLLFHLGKVYNNPWSKFAATLLLGITWCCYRGASLQLTIPDTQLNKPILVSGRIVSFLEHQPQRIRFEYLIDTINQKPCALQRVLMTEYSYNTSFLLASANRKDRWELLVRLKKPRGFWNPGSFDYQAWLLQKGIVATGVLVKSKKSKPPLKLASNVSRFSLIDAILDYIHHVRVQLNGYIQKSISRSKHIGLLQALITGERSAILPNQWEVMRSTGTNHLFAISGLHVGFIGGIAHSIVRFSWARLSFLYLSIPCQQAAYVGAWIAALGYSAISGLALPIQRAFIMFSIIVLALLQRRVLSVWQGWCTAMLFMLLLNPFIVLSESFWLSFGAVAIIFYGLGSRLKLSINISNWRKLWKGWGHTQWVVSIGLIPITLWFFQQVSLLGFIANLISIPWVGFIVLPISLVGALCYPIWPKGIGILILIGDKALGYLWDFLSYIATLPLSQYFLAIPNRWILITTSLSALLLIAPKGFPSRYYLGTITLLPLLLWKPAQPGPGEFWLTLLDVGQGLAVVVRTHQHTLVYDTGPRLGTNADAGSQVVIPYLRTLRINKIDRLIVSHGDDDHSGGAKSILNAMPVDTIMTSEVERLSIKNACYCQKGQSWQWDGVKFNLLHPTYTHQLKSNDASCVLHITTNSHQLLLPGDIHKKAEVMLLKDNPNLSKITLLVAPHHGSKTSSSLPFIERLRPQYILIAAGFQNRFKFPHNAILNRYHQFQSKVYVTSQEGAITVKFRPCKKEIKLESFYQKNKRFWH